MSDFQAIVENALNDDNLDSNDMDTRQRRVTHWQRTCIAGITAISAGCTAWLQLTAAAVVLNSNEVRMSASEKSLMRRMSNAPTAEDLSDVAGFGQSANSSKSKGKRKSDVELAIDRVGQNLADQMEHMIRAIKKSAEVVSTKAPRPGPNSKELFNALFALQLPGDYMLKCYQYLSKNAEEARMFVGANEEYRSKTLAMIMEQR